MNIWIDCYPGTERPLPGGYRIVETKHVWSLQDTEGFDVMVDGDSVESLIGDGQEAAAKYFEEVINEREKRNTLAVGVEELHVWVHGKTPNRSTSISVPKRIINKILNGA